MQRDQQKTGTEGPPSTRTRNKAPSGQDGFETTERSESASSGNTSNSKVDKKLKKGKPATKTGKDKAIPLDQQLVTTFLDGKSSQSLKMKERNGHVENSQGANVGQRLSVNADLKELEHEHVNQSQGVRQDYSSVERDQNKQASQHVPLVGATRSSKQGIISDAPLKDNPTSVDYCHSPLQRDDRNLATTVNALTGREMVQQREVGHINMSDQTILSAFNNQRQRQKDEMFQATQVTFTPGLLNTGMFNPGFNAGNMSTNEVYRILGEVNKTLKDIKKEIVEIKGHNTTTAEQIQGLSHDYDEVQDILGRQEKIVNRCQDKMAFLSNNAERVEHYMADFNNRLLKLEAGTTKNNLLISGLNEEEGEDCVKKCATFMENGLKLPGGEVKISDAYRLGKAKPGITRPIVMSLHRKEQKGVIFKNASKLKGTNQYVNDQLPEQLEEEQRRFKQITAANRKLPKEQQQFMKIEKGKLMIGEQGKNRYQFKPKVQVPTLKEINALDDDELLDICDMEMMASEIVEEKGSKFQVYVGAANSKIQIRRMYQHLKIKYPGATHITLAYRLIGLDKANDEGLCDDFEHGLGRKLLALLLQEEKKQIAVFSVRHYGGELLYKNRFDIPVGLATNTIKAMENGARATVSKLNLQQFRNNPRTVKQRRSTSNRGRYIGMRRLGKTRGSGASPSLAGNSRGNQLRSYMREMEEESDLMTCPTSATSEEEKTEEEDYLSLGEGAGGAEPVQTNREEWGDDVTGAWSSTDAEQTLTYSQDEDGTEGNNNSLTAEH